MKYEFLTTKIAALERTAKRILLKDVKASQKEVTNDSIVWVMKIVKVV